MTNDQAELMIGELRQMRKLLELMAEPAVAERDGKLRDSLREIVRSSADKQRAVLLMDGSRNQTEIATQAPVHQGSLSTMITKLEEAGLLADGKKRPKLAISIPSNFFDAATATKRR